MGKKHAEVMPPHITALFEQAFSRNKAGATAEYDYYLDVGGQTGWYAAKLSPILVDGEFTGSVAVIRNITERKRVEEALQTRTHELGERVKELNCLYGIANLIQTPDISLAGILQGVVALIPAAWQYPTITCAQIIIEGQVSAKTENFAVTPWQLTAPIIVRGESIGVVEVGYLEEKPARNRGPFLPEERRLLNAIAERLGRIIEQLRAEKTLHETEAKWRSLAETAPATIATLDRQGTILFINRPLLAEGLPKLVIGSSIYKYLSPQEQQRTRKIIEGVFQSGGVVRYETTAISSDGSKVCVENRIAPIKIGSQIVAATYMALDITTRKQAEERLRQAHNSRTSSDQPTPKLR
jgi:PAS domain S-box-containing protein